MREIRGRWSPPSGELVIEVYGPYKGNRAKEDVAEAIAGSDPNLILLERMGYNLSLKEGMEDVVRGPVALERASLASAIEEIMQLDPSVDNSAERKT